MHSTVDAETLAGFVAEVRGYLPILRAVLEPSPGQPTAGETLETAHRHVHTIRGAASLVGLDHVSRLLEPFEDALAAATAGRVTLRNGTLARFRETLRGLEQALEEVEPRPQLPADDLEELFARFEKPAETPAVPPEVVEVFALEAEDHLRSLNGLLPILRRQPNNKDVLQQIRRGAHTLKGSAAVAGFRHVTRLAHRMEDLLDLLYEDQRAATPAVVQLLGQSVEGLEDLVAGRRDPVTLDSLHGRYDAILGPGEEPRQPTGSGGDVAPGAPSPGDRFLRVPVERLDELIKRLGDLVLQRSAFEQRLAAVARQFSELQAGVERLRGVTARLETRAEEGAPAAAPLGLAPHGFDALEFDRYTELHQINRQLTEVAVDLQAVCSDLAPLLRDCDGLLARQTRLASDVQDQLLRLRMLPLAALAERLQGAVRTLAEQLGKDVALTIEGDATELDRTLLEQLAGPLLHLLRNAVDHGIEPPDVRRACGKPPRGTIRLHAARDGGQIVLHVGDDGAGIDLPRIRAAAIARGFLTEAEASAAAETELRDLVFRPGFSTACEVSEVSGRGVGLDVVRAQVHKFGGSVEVESAVGRGTTFTIRLPLTLAVARAVLVRAHQETWAIPLEAVRMVARLEPEAVQRRGEIDVVRVGGELLPLVRLGQCLRLRRPAEEGPRPPLLVLRAGPRTLAVVVDRVVGAGEVVVKSLGSHLRRVRGVAGATLLGDGQVVLILNPNELLPPAAESVRPAGAAARPLRVLVVDDSPSVRRVAVNLLTARGWMATPARDGREALEHLERMAELPDVILLDVEMPRMDGYELLAALRAEARYGPIPAVMVTSRGGVRHRRQALDLGAAGYLTKPFQEQELLNLVERLARRGAAADPRRATTPA